MAERSARSQPTSTSTGCVIVGGGPAGMVLGLLLARRGVQVRVLELHSDFERDFRGDTIHPSTMEMLDRSGLAEDLHKLRHGKLRAMRLLTPQRTWRLVQLDRLKTRFPYIADLAEVQRRREPAVRRIQAVQAVVQQRIVGETLRHRRQFVPPWPVRLRLKTPYLRDIPARMVAFGPRPYRLERAEEHPPA